MAVSRHVLKPKNLGSAQGAAKVSGFIGLLTCLPLGVIAWAIEMSGAAMFLCLLGIFICLPLSGIAWAMGMPGSGARIMGILGTCVWSLLAILILLSAFGVFRAAPLPPEEAPPPQYEDTPKAPPKQP